jgi:2-aminobenzoate-CoA ligase
MTTRPVTSHVDTFVLDRLPPPELCPEIDFSSLDGLEYPARLNAATELLDSWVAGGQGGRVVLRTADGTWTYAQLQDAANRIAHVLTADCGLVPGNRVLLRAPNNPMLVACWFAVLKAGGVAVTTMPLLRERELRDVLDQTAVTVAITDARVAADLGAAMAGREGACVLRYGDRGTGGEDSLDARMASKDAAF